MNTDLQVRVAIVIGVLLLSAVMLGLLHWFPWSQRLKRVEAYTVGVGVLLGIPVATMVLTHAAGLDYGQLFWAGLLAGNAAVSGATVRLAYAIDKRGPINLEDVARGPQR